MQLYPILNNNTSIETFDDHVEISRNGRMIALDAEFKSILKLCNGLNTTDNIIDSIRTKKDKITELLVSWGMLVQNEFIELYKLGKDRHEPIFPQALHIELTHKCNLKCFYCYQNSSPETEAVFIPTAPLFKQLLLLKDKGLATIELTGGEPLLHPEFKSIFQFCANNFTTISLLTNGILVDEKLVKFLKPYAEKTIINVSLDSHIPDKQDRITGRKKSFQKISNAIRLFSENGFLVRVATVVTEDTWEDLEDILLYSKKLGAKKFTFSPVIPEGRGANTFKLWKKNAQSVSEQEKKLVNKYKDYFHVLEKEEEYKTKYSHNCGAGHRAVAIAPNGDVRACESAPNDYQIGNIFSEPIETVFSNPLVYKFFILPNPSEEICGSCNYISFCNGCFFRAKLINKIEEDFQCKWLKNPLVKEWTMAMS